MAPDARNLFRRLAGALVAAAALVAPARAQDDLQFRHLGVDDGLPSSLVSEVMQDRRGFMWIGTARGLSRYDGHRFRTYGHEPGNPSTLPTGFVDRVYEDRQGTLWVVTAAGLSRYDGARDAFVTYLRRDDAAARSRPAAARGPVARQRVTAALEDQRGSFWVGTSTGLLLFDRRTGGATPFPLPAPRHASTSNAAAAHVMTLFEDRRARVWVGTRAGLYVLDSATRAAHHHAFDPGDPGSLPDSVVRVLAEDPAGRLWVGTSNGGLARWEAGTGRFTRFRHRPTDPHSLAKDRVVRLAADRAGMGLWVGTENGGLDFLDFATGRFGHHRFDPNTPSGIGSNSIWALHQDATGAIWVGTFSAGLDVSTPNGAAIRHYRTIPGDPSSLSYNTVPGFAEGRDGRVWVPTDGGGLNRFDPRTGRFTRFTPQNTNLNAEAVLGVVETRGGEVWVSTWGGGISRFDPERRRFTPYATANSNIPGDHVYEIVEDRGGRLWVGTETGDVAMFDRERRTFTRRFAVGPPGLPPSSVLLVRELHDGRFAVALREGGVAILDPRTGALAHHLAGAAGGLASNNVRALLEGGPGVLWVGTENGLDRLDLALGHVTAHWGERDGLPSAFVMGIAPDARGRLWISSDRGVSRFDPARGAFKHFTRWDGLQGGEFVMRAALRARDGTLYFGGNNGFSTVRPERLVENTRTPPVALTELQLFNRPVAVGAPGSPLRRPIGETDELRLTHAQNAIGFEFAALDYAAPEKTRYAYRMEGVDAEWQDVGAQHTAAYTNLAPGRYTFRVKASNGDGVWNEAGASVRVTIEPPVWQTWWFRLLGGAAAAGVVYRLLRFRERRRIEVALGRQALRDPLTGLANRALFRDRVEHALARHARHGALPAAAGAAAGAAPSGPRGVVVLFLDLDDFKTVNDSLGHHAGDQLLCAVAARLLNATRGCDTVARLGGDEFAVLLESASGPDAEVVAERIAAALCAPVPVGGGAGHPAGCPAGRREARVGVSVGIAFADASADADALLRNADVAMYQAKGDGKGRHAVFDPALDAAAAERQAFERDLAGALGRGEFALVYQPIVCLTTGAVAGAEALVRWRHPARGVVSPAQFIPLAEASGLIVELGRWVLDEACRAAAQWPAGSPGGADGPPGVTVNVSGRQLLHPALPDQVAGALAAAGLPPGRLTLEITESVLMDDTDAALRVLRALKALGVRLAVDDFGTGYSSLRYLQRFPVDVLKIDKSFVDGVAGGAQDAALARTIVALGDTLALRTVAEGVEHAEQRDELAAMGCAFGQGYLFARPLEDGALRALLAERAGQDGPGAAVRVGAG